MAVYEDEELLQLFADPDSRNHAFNLLVKKYQQRVYMHVRRIIIDHDDTDDVVQNTFIKVWMALDDFKGNSQLFTWIYRIATNEALNFLKKQRRVLFVPLINVEKQLSNAVATDPVMSSDQLQLKFQKALLQLPERQRVVFNMRYYDELKYEQIAEILDVSVGALKASYHHAVKKLEKLLTEH